MELVRKRQWKPPYLGRSAEIGGGTARPEKPIIARTSNTEPQVVTNTVVLDISGLARACILMKSLDKS